MSTTRSPTLPDEIREAAKLFGDALSINSEIHPDDHMFWYLHDHLKHPLNTALGHYFNGGKDNAEVIYNWIVTLDIAEQGGSVLEFAAGYGRVTRHLKRLLIQKHYVTSDIHPHAVEFNSHCHGILSYQSSEIPESLNIKEKFDFIFVLSLFSHLPDGLFRRWLRVLYDHLLPGGFLLITTHGEEAIRKAPAMAEGYDTEKGFGFVKRSDQPDLSLDIYGSTVSAPHYVIDSIYCETTGRLRSFRPSAWWGIQDEWIIQRPK